MSSDATLKTADFGLSCFFTPGTKESQACGTPTYIAPEVIREKYDEKADIWSIGEQPRHKTYPALLSFVSFYWPREEIDALNGFVLKVGRRRLEFELYRASCLSVSLTTLRIFGVLCGHNLLLQLLLQLISAFDCHSCRFWHLGVILYIMLSGKMPFYGKTDTQCLKSTLRGQYTFNHPNWRTVSKEAKEVVRLMLTYDPAKRPSAAELLGEMD